MLRAALKGMRRRKLRMALSGLAVVLVVMFVSGAMVLTDTLGRSFDEIFGGVYSHTDVQVHGVPKVAVQEFEGEQVPATIPDRVVAQVKGVAGVARATGLVEADGARLIGGDGKVVASFGPPQLGMNWVGEDPVARLREGRGPVAPDEIAIDAGLAKAAGVSLGDRVGVLTLQPRNEFTVVGIVEFSGGRDSLGGVQTIMFTDQVAQRLMLGEPDVWTGVDVRAADGVAAEELRDRVAAELGPGYRVRTGEQLAQEQSDQLKEGLAFFNYILLGFAGVSLFVGVFLILNTFSITIAQRSRELALTRAIGAGRGQVVGSVIAEAVIVGLLSSVLGVAAGAGVGALLAAVAAGFAELPLAGVAVPAGAVVAGIAVGLVVTVVAAVLPALRASRIPPVAAMQEAAVPDRPLTRISVVGGLVLAAGATLLGLGLTGTAGDQTLWTILAGVLVSFIGVALLTPLVARPVVAVLGRPFSWSVPGRLGRLNSGRNPRRTAITAAALMVGVALVTGVNVILESAKDSFAAYAEETIRAELVITGAQTGPRPPTFDPAVLDRVAGLPGVQASAGVYGSVAMVDGERTFVSAASDLATLSGIYGATATEGRLDTLGATEIAVDSQAAARRDLTVGDTVAVQLPRGEPRTLTVSAIFPANALPGRYLLPESATADFAVPGPYLGLVQLAPGAQPGQVEPAVEALLVDSPEVSALDRSGFVAQQTSQLDTVLIMIQVLLALAILIAVLGIVNTLALSVLERTRELGMLRAVGLGRAATMRMVTVESVVISVFGALLGVTVGTGLGAAVVRGLRDEGITRLAVPWSDLGTYLVLAGLVGVVAAVLPAIRAARTDVLAAIAYE